MAHPARPGSTTHLALAMKHANNSVHPLLIPGSSARPVRVDPSPLTEYSYNRPLPDVLPQQQGRDEVGAFRPGNLNRS